MYLATALEPTKDTARTRGSVRSWSTVLLAPCTRFKTPGGIPASCASSTMRAAVRGTLSDGFSTNVLPQAMAMGNIQSGTMKGKLNGVMPTQTPTGYLVDQLSTEVPTRSTVSPIISVGAPQANSMHSMPRSNDPCASSRVLPFSSITRPTSSSAFFSSSSRNLNSTLQRCTTGVLLQAGNALWAASTAAKISSAVQRGISATASPVAGLCCISFGPVEITGLPLMYSGQDLSSRAVALGVMRTSLVYVNFTLLRPRAASDLRFPGACLPGATARPGHRPIL